MHFSRENIRTLLESGDINKEAWEQLFSGVFPARVPECTDCLYFRNGNCATPSSPADCFLYGKMSRSEGVLLKTREDP